MLIEDLRVKQDGPYVHFGLTTLDAQGRQVYVLDIFGQPSLQPHMAYLYNEDINDLRSPEG